MKTPKNIFKCRIYDISYLHSGNKVTCFITFYNPILCAKQTVKGVAIRNPEDEYSITKGERIAEGRAKQEIYRKHTTSLIHACKIICNRNEKLINIERKHIQSLINKV